MGITSRLMLGIVFVPALQRILLARRARSTWAEQANPNAILDVDHAHTEDRRWS